MTSATDFGLRSWTPRWLICCKRHNRLSDGCSIGEISTDVAGNASTSAPWTLQFQQPDAGGNIVAHLLPASGGVIRFTAQPQVFGFSVATCNYSASSIQLSGNGSSNVYSIAVSSPEFTVQSGGSPCKARSGGYEAHQTLGSPRGDQMPALRELFPLSHCVESSSDTAPRRESERPAPRIASISLVMAFAPG